MGTDVRIAQLLDTLVGLAGAGLFLLGFILVCLVLLVERLRQSAREK